MSRIGWDAEAEGGPHDDAHCIFVPVSSSFTAINSQPSQLLTPRSSGPPIRQNTARRRAAGARRRHNPAVAEYLGLGNKSASQNLDNHGLLSPMPESSDRKPARKRQRVTVSEVQQAQPVPGIQSMRSLNQMQFDESLSTGQTACRPIAVASRDSSPVTLGEPSSSRIDFHSQLAHDNIFFDLCQNNSLHVGHKNPAIERAPRIGHSAVQQVRSTKPLEQLQVLAPSTYRGNIDGPLNIISDSYEQKIERPIFEEDDFNDDLSDNELLMLMSDADESFLDNASKTLNPSLRSDNQAFLGGSDCDHDLDSFTLNPAYTKEDATIRSTEALAKAFVSPVTVTTRLLAAGRDTSSPKSRKPIVRPAFPASVRDRSPIIGLSSKMLLRTCFRIGEAINQSYQASKSDQQIIIELYARVLGSKRTDKNQVFTFCDLFHAKPPYIKAVYDAAIWKPVQLFEYDSRRLLQEGRMCRCIGTMKRKEKEWIMTVHNIWEATWDDISWVEGIVGS